MQLLVFTFELLFSLYSAHVLCACSMHVILCDSAKCKSPLIFNLIFSLKLLHLIFTFSSLVSLCSLKIIVHVSEIIHDHNPRTFNKPSLPIFWHFLLQNITHTHASLSFFLLSTFYLSMATPYILLFLWMNEWMCVFISERVRGVKCMKRCCAVVWSRTSKVGPAKQRLWEYLKERMEEKMVCNLFHYFPI